MKHWKLVNLVVCLSLLLNLAPGGYRPALASGPAQQSGTRLVDIVFVVDTSGSMDEEFSTLCSVIDRLVTDLEGRGIQVRYTVLGIAEPRACASQHVAGSIHGATASHKEDWGPAVRDLAVAYDWQPGYTRVVVPMSDEGPYQGSDSGCLIPGDDEDSITEAIRAANSNSVRAAPILGDISPGADPACIQELAERLANGTGGAVFNLYDDPTKLADGITALIEAVAADKDGDGIPDDDDPAPADPCKPDRQAVCLPKQVCGLTNTPHWDDDKDKRTDEEIQNGADDDGDGLIDEDVGGVDCPYPDQDCGVNSHRGFDDDDDGRVDEEEDNGRDDDSDNYVDEDVHCPCPAVQEVGVNDTPGVDDDHDFQIDEEADDGADNDEDGCVDEDVGTCSAQVDSIEFDPTHYNTIFSKYIYGRGKTVQATATVSSASGGSFEVVARVVDNTGNSTDLPAQTITLSPGESQDLTFNWEVPTDGTLWEYDFEAEVNQTDGIPVAFNEMHDAFFVSGVTNQELSAFPSECMPPKDVCGNAVMGVIPFIGMPFNWIALQDLLCQLGERAALGDTIGAIMILLRIINAALEVAHEVIGLVLTLGASEISTSSFHSAIGGAADCAEAALYELVRSKCGTCGYTCMARRMLDGFASIFSPKTTLIVVSPSKSASDSAMHSKLAMASMGDGFQLPGQSRGTCPIGKTVGSLSLQAEGVLARLPKQKYSGESVAYSPPARVRITDSNGDYVEFNDQSQIVVAGVGMVYRIGDDAQLVIMEGQGSYKDIEILGLENATVDVNVLQVTDDGTAALSTFEQINTTPSSVADIHLATNETSSDLQLDTDGDGNIDRRVAPVTSIAPPTSSGGGSGIVVLVLALATGAAALVVVATRRRRRPVLADVGVPGVRATQLVIIRGKQAGTVVPIGLADLTIGRSRAAGLQLTHTSVSRHHAVIRYARGRYYLQDQGSTHGTFVNGRRIDAVALNPGDRITIGDTEFELRLG